MKKDIIGVNTLHHQAIKDIGNYVIPSGITADGLIESYYIEGKKFFLGVQWHPELLYKNYEDHRKMISKFQ